MKNLLRPLFCRNQLEADMAEEMRAHIEEQTQRNIAAGMSETDARAAAHRQFGGVAQIQERARDVLLVRWMDDLVRTLRAAFRSLRRHPGFASVAIVMLALGIGLSTSCFSVTNFLLLRAMPFPEGNRLMRVFATDEGSRSMALTAANYFDLKSAATSFSAMASITFWTANVAEPDQPPVSRWGMSIDAEFFPMLGIQPLLGRGFAPEEYHPGHDAVVLLPHRFWTRHFRADPAIIGRIIHLGRERVTVVGILPPSFDEAPLWGSAGFVQPSSLGTARNNRVDPFVHVVARLKSGVSVERAQSELDTIAARLASDHPRENSGRGLRVTGLYASNKTDGSRASTWLITGLAMLVLVIACANLVGVQLARAFARNHEYATRLALGARRRDLLLPAAAEGLLLTGCGGAGGVFVAIWLNRAFSHFLSEPDAPASVVVDIRVALFALGVCVLTGITFGILPAWLSSGPSSAAGSKLNARNITPARSQTKWKQGLVVGQFVLVAVLLSAAASLTLPLKRALDRDLGWHTGDLVVTTIDAPYATYSSITEQLGLARALKGKLSVLPGLELVTSARFLPLFGYERRRIAVEGQPSVSLGQEPIASVNAVDPGFFSALSIPLKEGRDFPVDLRADQPRIAIVSESLAHAWWPGHSAIGRRLRLADQDTWIEVIGVVGDVTMALNFDQPEPSLQLYLPLAQAPSNLLSFCLKTPLPSPTVDVSVRKAIAAIDPTIVVQPTDGLRRSMEELLAGNDLAIAVVGAFALIGLLIALLGIYGLVTQLTLQRTREIGIRIALGADGGAVIKMIVLQVGRVVLTGAILGWIGAFGIDRIYVHTMPALVLPGADMKLGLTLILGLAGLCACWLPARRAARVDPIVALRSE